MLILLYGDFMNINKKIKALLVILLYFLYTSGLYMIPIYVSGVSVAVFNRFWLCVYFFTADVLLMCILGIIYNKEIISGFKSLTLPKIEFGVKIWIIGMVIMGISNMLISSFSPITVAGNEESVKNALSILPIYMAFSTVLYAPFVEEIVFRQTLRDLFKNNTLFIICAGLLFGGIHIMDFYTSYYDLLFVMPYGALGVCFAYIYSKTNNLTISMILHAVHNGLLVLLFFLF